MRNAYKILFRKPERKKPLGRSRYKWEDNIRMYLTEIGLEDMDWMHLAHCRNQCQALVNTVMYLWVPQKAGLSRLAE